MNEQSPYEQGNGPIDEKMLLKFLRGELSEQEASEMEAKMAASDFEKDALEGLSMVSTPIDEHVQKINLHLETQLKKKNKGRKKRQISLRWIYLALIILLGLIVIAYTVLHLHYRQ
ncbi:MAG: hypothetical protein ACO1NW_10060 [Chitinophagaceae bacterium]